eukprot:TRINITY_DN265_c0_g2_i9.p1 TRINITY_DN265_c0_g2~~TRINITY_DN265_c0_g2_i9.p1  ORF type:complete len:145 (+),score=31.65 TRINITY_DN265_c0_g2_i9:134-568(+)
MGRFFPSWGITGLVWILVFLDPPPPDRPSLLNILFFSVFGYTNDTVAEEYVGSADRILMGYLPNTYDFISRALQFAKKNEPVTVHYHHLCKKSEYRVLALKDWTEVMKVQGFRGNVRVDAFTKVKSYAPLLFHCCADLLLLVEG